MFYEFRVVYLVPISHVTIQRKVWNIAYVHFPVTDFNEKNR